MEENRKQTDTKLKKEKTTTGFSTVHPFLLLRQGEYASMEWFCFGIDPLLRYLERRLNGIVITSIPVLGPVLQGESMPLAPVEERYKLIAYCDDVKPNVTSMAEFFTVDKACCTLFEKSSGYKLHRDPASGKCKFLSLGRWRGILEQCHQFLEIRKVHGPI